MVHVMMRIVAYSDDGLVARLAAFPEAAVARTNCLLVKGLARGALEWR